MRRMKLVGLALVAMFALSALAAVAAQAQPTFEKEGGGSVAGISIKSSSSGGEMVASTNHVKCTASSSGGEITGASTVAGVVVSFTGCTLTNGGNTCEAKSPGASANEIKTVSLSGELVTTKVGSKVGELLKPTSGSTYATIDASCGTTTETTVTGSIVGEVKPVEGAFSNTGELVYEKTAKENEQKIHEYQNPAEESKTITGAELKAFGLLKSALAQTNTVEFGAKLKVKK